MMISTSDIMEALKSGNIHSQKEWTARFPLSDTSQSDILPEFDVCSCALFLKGSKSLSFRNINQIIDFLHLPEMAIVYIGVEIDSELSEDMVHLHALYVGKQTGNRA